MGKLIFVTGGTRSGKSSYAQEIAISIKKEKLFIATCIPEDDEMKERVRLHKLDRPSSWRTIEENKKLLQVIREETKEDIVIIIDCLTLFISYFLMKGRKGDFIKAELEQIVETIKNGNATVIIISNEVGSSLVPENKLGRDFRDIVGFCNQIAAKDADEVFYVVAGIPIKIKGDSR